MTPDLLITLGGSVAGYVMKLISLRSQQQHDLFLQALKLKEASDASMNQAIQRVGADAGKFVRRLIVMCVLFGVIFLPMLAPLFGVPLVVEGRTEDTSFLFGLIEVEGTKIFEEVHGILLIPELRQCFLALVAFYFGQGAARAR